MTIVLHGNFDRPEWECETWGQVAAARGFVLCPRGVPVKGIDKSLDRWTYRNQSSAQREIAAALASLEERYPGKVSREHLVLVGFSLGAIFAPKLAAKDKIYQAVFLVEGGIEQLEAVGLPALRSAGVKGLGFAMSAPGRRKQAQRVLLALKKAQFPAVFVDMVGAGHNYSR
ncbi:MAG: hypothetical protein MUC50_19380, partial [Myxococcota bacterium]|nr:hypothetical protein [Myxococcota bacterium]